MNLHEVVIIDYGLGNLLSVQRALEHCGAKVLITADPKKILLARRVVLPGVGAFANAMQVLQELNLIPVIHELSERRTPLLGICLGMQLLLDESNEFGFTKGLGLIPGRVIGIPDRTSAGLSQKIPHVGWNELEDSNNDSTLRYHLLQDISNGDAVYFVHSFMAIPKYSKDLIAHCFYGEHKIAAMVARENIIGCQFHPEKSGEIGLKILKRFCFD